MNPLRRINSLSISETRWLAYATAGVASALGVSRSAEAEIHYSGLVNIELEGHFNQNHYSVFLPLTNGASLLFTEFYFTSARAYFFVRGGQQGSALAFFTYSNCRALQKLEKGDPIRSCDNCSNPRHFASVAGFPGRGGIMGYQIGHGHFYCYSSLECNAGGIIGFKFNAGNGPQFGWARILGPDAYHHYRYEIKEYAWADPGERIVAGQRSSTELGSVSENVHSACLLRARGASSCGAASVQKRLTNA